MYEENSFLTLTYNDENLPKGGTLNLIDIQLFMKKLRKSLEPKKVRFFQCGEYGQVYDNKGNVVIENGIPILGRPHHHIILFNHQFKDTILFKEKKGNKIYQSPTLEKIWGKGFCTIGNVTFQSSTYVARYITKKINGKLSKEHYKGRKKEFITMSRGGSSSKSRAGGIGAQWLTKFRDDIYPDNFVVINNKKVKTPKYYDDLFAIADPEGFAIAKNKREVEPPYFPSKDNTNKRLSVRERVQTLNQKTINRSIERETEK